MRGLNTGVTIPETGSTEANVRAFESIAVETGQSEIIQHGLASVFLRNDVIRLVRKEGL